MLAGWRGPLDFQAVREVVECFTRFDCDEPYLRPIHCALTGWHLHDQRCLSGADLHVSKRSVLHVLNDKAEISKNRADGTHFWEPARSVQGYSTPHAKARIGSSGSISTNGCDSSSGGSAGAGV